MRFITNRNPVFLMMCAFSLVACIASEFWWTRPIFGAMALYYWHLSEDL